MRWRRLLKAFTPGRLFVVFMLLAGFVHLLIVVCNHYFFRTYAYDYAVYNFAFHDFAHLRLSPDPVYMVAFPITFMQDHFSLTLPMLSPFYWLFAPITGSYTLLVFQWLFIMAGAIYTWKFIKLKSESKWLALGAVVYYFFLFGRYAAYQNDCNLAIIGAAYLPAFLYYFEARNLYATLITALLLLVNREDAALTLVFLSLYLMITHWTDPRLRKWSAWIIAGALVFFVLEFTVFIPSLEDENKKFSLFNYTALGQTPGEALRFIFAHPFDTLSLLYANTSGNASYDSVKTSFYLLYFVSGGFLLFSRPLAFIPLIPLIAKRMFNDNVVRWGIEYYHSVEIVTILPALVFMAIASYKVPWVKIVTAWPVIILSLAASLCTASLFDNSKYNFLHKGFYRSVYDTRKLHKLMAGIPENSGVSASCRALPHLAMRDSVRYFPMTDHSKYIFLLKKEDSYPLNDSDYYREARKYSDSPDWEVVLDDADVLLYKKK
jgi:uncharacterized membrane protein